MKERLSVYLDPTVAAQLAAYAARRNKSLSLVAEAAIASFLSPDGPDRLEAAVSRRLDRISRQTERLERDLGISVEMLALFVRHWLTVTPSSPDLQGAAQAKGRERFERFVEALGRRLATGRSFSREVSEDVAAAEFSEMAGDGSPDIARERGSPDPSRVGPISAPAATAVPSATEAAAASTPRVDGPATD